MQTVAGRCARGASPAAAAAGPASRHPTPVLAAMETGVHHINSFSGSIQILPITALLLLILPTLLSHSLIWKATDFSWPRREAGGGRGEEGGGRREEGELLWLNTGIILGVRKKERRSIKIKKRETLPGFSPHHASLQKFPRLLFEIHGHIFTYFQPVNSSRTKRRTRKQNHK